MDSSNSELLNVTFIVSETPFTVALKTGSYGQTPMPEYELNFESMVSMANSTS